jgi:tetratricopeptide (TPR) repeat protein
MTAPSLAAAAQTSRPAPPAAGTGPPPGRVPAARSGTIPALADAFTTRPETAPGLPAGLVPGATVALVSAIAGQPGQRVGSCGKTQLAVSLAQTLWRCGRMGLLAWVDASSRASVLSGYAEAAAAVGIDPAGPAEKVATRFAGWLDETTRPWLVVLDDLRDPTDLGGLWPTGPNGMAVITARDPETVAGQPRAQVVPVGAFSTREALNYLMSRLASDPDQRHGAIDLATTLEGDPCALTHASAVLATTTQTCRDYQHHYTTTRAHLAAHQAGGEPPAAPAVPAVTWLLSAERAEQLSPGGTTQLLLALTALMDGQPVPGPVFTTQAVCTYLADAGAPAVDADRAWQAVRVLEHTGLLTIDPTATPPVVRISRQVAALVRAAMPGQMLERAAHAAAGALLEIWPQDEPQPWIATGLRSCVAALLQTGGDRLWTPEACHPLLRKAGHSLDAARLTGPAVRYWTHLATTSNHALGPDNPHTLTTGTHLARALLTAGQAAEAAAWWQWVAAGRTRASGPDHPGTLTARVNLGHAMTAADKPSHAVTILEQAVAAYQRLHGPAHPDTLTARDKLAAACQAAGQPNEATSHYRSILADRERHQGKRHPETITARERLARACLAGDRLKEAIVGYKETLADRQRVQGPDHLDTIAARRNLATAYHTAGKIAASLQHHDQVCAAYQRALGAGHRHTLTACRDLADAYHAAGRLTDAITLLRDTLARCQQTLPAGDPLTHTLRQTINSIAGKRG